MAIKTPDSFLAIGHRYFAAVAAAGSIRAASRELNVAASAISRQLLLLEAQLGIDLFERHGRQLKLTAAGEALLAGLRNANAQYETVMDQLTALRGLKRGKLRVATVESISASLLPALLIAFADAYPGIDVSVTVAGSDAVTELVRQHEADLGFTFNPISLEGLAVEFTRDMQLGAIMAPGHPLAKARRLSLGDCLAHPVAWPSRGLSLRAILDRALGSRRSVPRMRVECNSLRLMAALARDGNCIGFQTEIGVEDDLAAGSLVFVPLVMRKLPLDQFMVVRRSGSKARPVIDAFLAIARQHLRDSPAVRK
ncbi:MAG: LysR family transcriptional regulator [Rhizobiales bacterium]|nr:LysR family transcriptional regulator [Hyphomicrobiales bacterium]